MKKDILVIAFIILLITVLVSGTNIQSVDDYYITHIDDINEDSDTIFISIQAATILDNWEKLDPTLRDEKYVPKDGIILEETEYVLRPDDSVFDILNRATRHNRIQMEFQGADKTAYNSIYIRGINYLYEFSCGPLSGWMYLVNDEFPDFGVNRYELKDGDTIDFKYTCDLGRDLGHDFRKEKSR